MPRKYPHHLIKANKLKRRREVIGEVRDIIQQSRLEEYNRLLSLPVKSDLNTNFGLTKSDLPTVKGGK